MNRVQQDSRGMTILRAAVGARRGVALSDSLIRVVAVDDHSVIRSGLQSLLRGTQDVSIVGEATTAEEAIQASTTYTPTVMLVDLDVPGATRTDLIRQLASPPFSQRVVVLTMHDEAEWVLEALDAGALGYVTKDTKPETIVEAIRSIARDIPFVESAFARRVLAQLNEGRQRASYRSLVDTLSDRERTIVEMIASGFSAAEIGRLLGISAKSVESYKDRVEQKVGISRRPEFVRFALETGLLKTGKDSVGR